MLNFVQLTREERLQVVEANEARRKRITAAQAAHDTAVKAIVDDSAPLAPIFTAHQQETPPNGTAITFDVSTGVLAWETK